MYPLLYHRYIIFNFFSKKNMSKDNRETSDSLFLKRTAFVKPILEDRIDYVLISSVQLESFPIDCYHLSSPVRFNLLMC